MGFAILFFVFAALGLGVMIWLLVRHWHHIRLLDPSSLKEEQFREKRSVFIKQRFDRLRAERMQPIKRMGRLLVRHGSRMYSEMNQRLQSFENAYKQVKNPFASLAPSTRDRVKRLLLDGHALVRDLKFADAEKRFLEILSLDARHAEAYKGLGQIYLKQKLYPQAKETYEFLVKIKQADDAVFAALAEIAESEGNIDQAEQFRLKAIQASPRQACRQIELAQFYVSREAWDKAWPLALRALELERNSQKYLELVLEIAIGRKDKREARARFDKLRMMMDDEHRVRMWREKVEAL